MPTKSRMARRATEPQAGYVLLTLLLFITLLIIVAAAAAPKLAFTIKRDREQELIHRGVQYTRAIRAFSRKFGRYPNSIDELQNINGQKFLRKHYKDPITGEDFKFLHLTDVQFSGGPGVAALMQGSRQVSPANVSASINPVSPAGPPPAEQNPDAAADPNALPASSAAESRLGQNAPAQTPANSETPSNMNAVGNSTGASSFGGGAIVGVVSRSKDRSIREFSHKSHYSDWKFYYDPGYDRGFPISGPTVKIAISSGTPSPGETTPQ